MKFKVESATDKIGELVILITPLEVVKVSTPDYFIAIGKNIPGEKLQFVDRIKKPLVLIEASLLWNRLGSVSRNGNILLGKAGDRKYEVFTIGEVVEEFYMRGIRNPYLAVRVNSEIGII